MCKINKVKNFEGRYFTCAICGANIKHAYRVTDSKNGYVYGSECVYKAAGINPVHADKKIKELKSREKSLKKILSNKGVYSWDSYKEMLGLNEEQMINKYLETGQLG
ncbi:MAG TPA: hypothetical protein VLA13_08795 [Massilibacterium sp.]|nr:hypothetical protein [Massilibacterium sp.]